MKVRLTDRAQNDQDALHDYLAERSPGGAKHVMFALESAFRLLSEHPKLGRTIDGGEVRELTLTRYPYRIFYRVVSDRVDIVHIRHAARRPWSH